MSDTKHTPGPWEYEATEGSRWGWVTEEGRDGHGRVICRMEPNKIVSHADKRRRDSVVLDAQDCADARLLAAAPELLAACREALEYLECNTVTPREARYIDTLLAAIAKAEGAR